MSSLLEPIRDYFPKIMLPTILFTSVLSNSLNIVVLRRYKLRKYPCNLYFTALAVNNLVYSSTILLISALDGGYQIQISGRSSIACKLVTYFGTLLSALSPSFIILASIDRWCMSSSNLQRRRFSNARLAKLLIISVTIFFLLLFLISFITADTDATDPVKCRIRGDALFVQSFGIFQFLFFSCLGPITMSVFGCMTIYNVRQCRRLTASYSFARRTETQLVRMLLVQVGAQILFTLPICIVGLLISFPVIYNGPTPNIYVALNLTRIVFQMSYAAPFFLYVMSGSSFRKECAKILMKILPRTCHRRIGFTSRRR